MSKKVARKRKSVTKEEGNDEVNIPEEVDTDKSIEGVQKDLDQSVVADMLGVKDVVLGIELRPLTLASIALLSQVKSPLIDGVEVDEIDNILLEICIFITLQSCDVNKATELAFGDRPKLIAEAMKIANTINANEVEIITGKVIQLISDSVSTQVEAIPDKSTSTAPEKPVEGND
tara:strand:+ start:18478 stop:19002 length:525 start_codon:yes stop_codon:yes gene_type:complete